MRPTLMSFQTWTTHYHRAITEAGPEHAAEIAGVPMSFARRYKATQRRTEQRARQDSRDFAFDLYGGV